MPWQFAVLQESEAQLGGLIGRPPETPQASCYPVGHPVILTGKLAAALWGPTARSPVTGLTRAV